MNKNKKHNKKDGVEALSKRRNLFLMGASQSYKSFLSKLSVFLFFIIFISLISISAQTSTIPTATTNAEWKVTHTTDIDYTSYLANAKDKKTVIGLIPLSNSCLGLPATKRLYNKDGTEIKDDKNKPIDLKCESSKCDGKNCYSISLTTAQAVNIKDYIKIGLNSTTFEWVNSTLYIYDTDKLDLGDFTLEIYKDDIKMTTSDLSWASLTPIAKDIPFYANIQNFTARNNITFRLNKLEERDCKVNQFQTTCNIKTISFEDFEAKNSITDKIITPIYATTWEAFLAVFPLLWNIGDYQSIPIAYDIRYEGNIVDLDPYLNERVTTATSGFYNNTKASNLGVGFNEASLSMDFNNPPELTNNENITYIKDGSITNSYGTIGNTTGLIAQPIWNETGGISGSGAYYFGGYGGIDTNLKNFYTSSGRAFTISAWVNFNNYSSRQTIVAKRHPSDNDGQFNLLVDNDDILVNIYSDYAPTGSTYLRTDGAILGGLSGWHHMVIQKRSGSTADTKIYLDGTSVPFSGDDTKGGCTYSWSTTIGAGKTTSLTYPTLYPATGYIDNVQIWNDILPEKEVLALYNQTANQTVKYSPSYNGDYTSLVFYNSTSIFWNITTLNSANPNLSLLSDPSLVSHWKLDTNLIDEKGTNDGVCSGLSCPSNATGLNSEAMYFDGVDDYITTADTPFDDADEQAISVWVKTGIAGKYAVAKRNQFYILTGNSATSGCYFLGTGAAWVAPTTNTADNNWHHIVCDMNGSAANIYVDGILENSIAHDSTVSTANYNLDMGFRDGTGGYFSGIMDEVLFYNSSLTPTQITQLYKSGLSQYANTNITVQTRTASSYNTTGVVAQYSFNNNNTNDYMGVYNGTNSGATFGEAYGVVGFGANFDGSSNFVNTTYTEYIDAEENFTTSVWFKTTTASWDTILGGGDLNGVEDGLRIVVDNVGGIYYYSEETGYGGSAKYVRDASKDYRDGKWHHIVASRVYHGGVGTATLYLYVDGILATPTLCYAVCDGNWSFEDVFIGAYNTPAGGAGLYFPGQIDEVRFYKREVTQEEVNSLYNLGSSELLWTDWSNNTVIEDEVKLQSSTYGEFMQFKVGLNTNDSSISPYLFNYSVTYGGLGTPPDTSAPTCTLLSKTPTDIADNSTGALSFVLNCTDPAGINITKIGDHYPFFITRTVDNYGVSAGIPNYWSIRYPNNSLGVTGGLTPPFQIWRALGRNEGYWYDNLTGSGLSDCTGLTPCNAPINDTFSYAIEDGEYGHFTITPTDATNRTVIINYTHPAVQVAGFRQVIPLSWESLVKEDKKNITISSNNPVLIKSFDPEAYRNASNYTANLFINLGVVGSPTKNERVYYCNSSYDISAGVKLIDSPFCDLANTLTGTDVAIKSFTEKNSSYIGITFAVTNGLYGGIKTTSEYYLGLETSQVPVVNYYQLRFVNGSTNTDIGFNETKTAWTSSDDGLSWTQANWTADMFTTFTRKLNDEFQFGYYIKDNLGNVGYNFTFVIDEITETNHPISYPEILRYNSSITTNDLNLNGTHKGVMNIYIDVARDPDYIDNVTHNLTLRNLDGSYSSVINGSFKSPNDLNMWISFNTSLIAEGYYKMNISAVAGDNPLDLKSRLTDEFFVIDNTPPRWFNDKTNLTAMTTIGSSVYFNITFDDVIDGGSSIFSWFNGSEWINDSIISWGALEELSVTKTVNIFSGEINWTWYFNDSAGNLNKTDEWHIDLEAIPLVTNIFPEETSYAYVPTEINYSLTSLTPDKCWYSLDLGESNSTTVDAGNNFTGVSGFAEGSNTYTVYCNNSMSIIGSDSSTFTINLPPTLTIYSPLNITYNSSTIDLKMKAVDMDGIDKYWYTLDGGANVIFTPNTTVSTTGYEVYHTLNICANDTLGTSNCELRRFFVGSTFTEVDPIWNATLPQECPEGYNQYGFYSNGTIKCRVDAGSGTGTASSCKLTKRISDGYFPYGKFGCAIEFI